MTDTAEMTHQDNVTSSRSDDPVTQLVRTLREIFDECGLKESTCGDDEGFYFSLHNTGEISIQYNAAERTTNARPSNDSNAGLFACCGGFLKRGFAVTLFVSARTSALHVRSG